MHAAPVDVHARHVGVVADLLAADLFLGVPVVGHQPALAVAAAVALHLQLGLVGDVVDLLAGIIRLVALAGGFLLVQHHRFQLVVVFRPGAVDGHRGELPVHAGVDVDGVFGVVAEDEVLAVAAVGAVFHGGVLAGLHVADGHLVVVALEDGHVGHQHGVVEGGGRLADAAAHALDLLVAGVLRGLLEAALEGAGPHHRVEIAGVAGIDHVAVEEAQGRGHVAAAVGAAEGHVGGELGHHLHFHVVRGHRRQQRLHRQLGAALAGFDQGHQVVRGPLPVQLHAVLRRLDDLRPGAGHRHLGVHRGDVDVVVQLVHEDLQGLLVIGDLAGELGRGGLQVLGHLLAVGPAAHMAQVPGQVHLVLVIVGRAKIRRPEIPAAVPVGQRVGGVQPPVPLLRLQGAALVVGVARQAHPVDVYIVHKALHRALPHIAHQPRHAQARAHQRQRRQPQHDAQPQLRGNAPPPSLAVALTVRGGGADVRPAVIGRGGPVRWRPAAIGR